MAKPPVILVAHDLEATGDVALGWAAGLAERRSAHLVVLHVVDDRLGNLSRSLAGGAGPMPSTADLTSAAEARLAQRLGYAVPTSGSAEVRIATGGVAATLVEEARARAADLLVAGVRRHGRQLLPGHAHAHLLHHATCPLLLVHADDPTRGAPHGPGQLRHVLLAMDADEDAARAAADALRLLTEAGREDGGLRVTLLEASHQPALVLGGETRRRGTTGTQRRSPELATLERAAARLRARGHSVPGLEGPTHVAAAELCERAEALHADLVVTALAEGGLLRRLGGGVAGRAAPRLPCPLLHVPVRSGTAA